MTQIFDYAWQRKEGPEKVNGKHTQAFLLWCEKTEKLTDQQWTDGFDVLENKIKQDVENGRQTYPPSYIEFIAYTNMKPKPTDFYRARALPDAAQRKKDHDAGVTHLAKIKSLLRS